MHHHTPNCVVEGNVPTKIKARPMWDKITVEQMWSDGRFLTCILELQSLLGGEINYSLGCHSCLKMCVIRGLFEDNVILDAYRAYKKTESSVMTLNWHRC